MSDFSSLKYFPDSENKWFRYSTRECFRDDEDVLKTYPEISTEDLERLKSNPSTTRRGKRSVTDSDIILDAPSQDTIAFFRSYIRNLDIDRVFSAIGSYNGNPAVRLGSLVQHRSPYVKWMSVKGTTTKTVALSGRIDRNRPVFITFGMGDYLVLKNAGLQYIALSSDGSWKNNDEFDKAIRELKGCRIRIFQDNDPDIHSRLTIPLVKHIRSINRSLEVKWYVHTAEADKSDIRDLNNSFESVDEFRYYLLNEAVWANRTSYADEFGQTVVPFDRYIDNNVSGIKVSEIDRGVILAPTGSGKTFSIKNQPDTLLVVPLNSIVGDVDGLFKGTGTGELIDEIMVNGSAVTYNKFYGHYTKSEWFRTLVDSGNIKVVVDEAHTLLRTISPEHRLLYGLKNAVYMSGTLIPDFRRDLPHYKFVEREPLRIYSAGKVPDRQSLIFVENAKVCAERESYYVGTEAEGHEGNVDLGSITEEAGDIYATSAIREGVSIEKSSLKQVVVVKNGYMNSWTLGDCIQALQRVRHDADRFIVVKEPLRIGRYYKNSFDMFKDKWRNNRDTDDINTATGAIEKLAYYMSGSDEESEEYRLLCFLSNVIAKNWVDEDMYEVIHVEDDELVDESEASKPNGGFKRIYTRPSDATKPKECVIEYKGRKYTVSRNKAKRFEAWQNRYLKDGSVGSVMRLNTDKSVKELFVRANFVKRLKAQYNGLNTKGRGRKRDKYTVAHFIRETKEIVYAEYLYEDRRYTANDMLHLIGNSEVDFSKLYLDVIHECPIEEVALGRYDEDDAGSKTESDTAETDAVVPDESEDGNIKDCNAKRDCEIRKTNMKGLIFGRPKLKPKKCSQAPFYGGLLDLMTLCKTYREKVGSKNQRIGCFEKFASCEKCYGDDEVYGGEKRVDGSGVSIRLRAVPGLQKRSTEPRVAECKTVEEVKGFKGNSPPERLIAVATGPGRIEDKKGNKV